jgi:class 3 adenylate cyclase
VKVAFRLRRYFSIASGVALVFTAALLSWAYYRDEVADQIESTEARNVYVARVFANAIRPLEGSGDREALDRRLLNLSRDAPVVKIKIYNRAGTAIYSSVPAEIGEDKSANPGFREAIAGRAVSELTHRGSMSVTEGRIENVDVVSTYIPVAGGEQYAVFELYSDITDALNAIQRAVVRLLGFLAVVFGGLYAALLYVVSRADRILQRQHRELREAETARLKRFFSPQVAELIASGGMDDPLQTRRREITVVSLDLRGFTAFTESAEPEEVIDALRAYHGEMGRLIAAHEGTIEHFAGDGIMVIFNDPLPVPNAAERAVRMALAMQEAFEGLRVAWQARGFDLGLGIGIAQGYATIGGVGFEGRRDYTAIGTVTNLATRLCGSALTGEILLERRVKASLPADLRLEGPEEMRLKGFAQPVATYRVKHAARIVELRRPGVAA